MNPIEELHTAIDACDLWEEKIALKRNEYLKVQGSTDTRLYYITEGCLRIFVVDEFEEHTLRFGYSGNFIAALDSFITEQPSDFFIQALRKTEVKILGKVRYMDFVKSNPQRFQLWLTILEQLVYQQLERERDLLTASPAERYRRVLERSPQLFQEVPNKYIAAYLRMTPETLSRLKKQNV